MRLLSHGGAVSPLRALTDTRRDRSCRTQIGGNRRQKLEEAQRAEDPSTCDVWPFYQSGGGGESDDRKTHEKKHTDLIRTHRKSARTVVVCINRHCNIF